MKHVTLKKEKKRKEFIRIHSLTFGYDFIPIHLHSIIVEESSTKTCSRDTCSILASRILKIVTRLGSSLKSQGLLGPDISRRWQLHG